MASVNKRANGRWEVRYLVGDKHKSKSFPRKKDADVFAADVETKIATGKLLPTAAPLSVRAVCEAYLRDAEARRSDGRIGVSRLRNLKQAIDVSIIPILGAMKATDLRATHVEDFYQQVRDGGVKPSTALDRLGVLKLVEDYALRRGIIAERVVPEGMKSLRGIKRDRIRTFSLDDMRALLAALEERPLFKHERAHEQLRCVVHLAAICGLRWGEIMALRLGNLDFDGGVLRVRHSILASDELKGPKTAAGNRTVGLPAAVADLLKKWLARFYIPNERELVFRTRTGGMTSPGSFHQHDWRPLLKQAGLLREADNFHFHALRHFAASWRIERGMSLMDVAADLGHEKFDTTLQVYAHPIAGAQRRHEAVEQMAVSLLAKPPLALNLRTNS